MHPAWHPVGHVCVRLCVCACIFKRRLDRQEALALQFVASCVAVCASCVAVCSLLRLVLQFVHADVYTNRERILDSQVATEH